jgi:hypothetical protein
MVRLFHAVVHSNARFRKNLDVFVRVLFPLALRGQSQLSVCW